MTLTLLHYPVGADPEVRVIQYSHAALRALIGGGDAYLEAVYTRRPGVVVWCDDSYLLKNLPENRYVPVGHGGYLIGGPFFVTRVHSDGETGSLTLADIEWLRANLVTSAVARERGLV